MQSISRAEHRRSRRESAKRPQWGTLEEFARRPDSKLAPGCAGGRGHRVAGRGKLQRRAVVDAPVGYRNGDDKTPA